MKDNRLRTLAKLLVEYSTEVKRGQFVQLLAPSIAEPLIIELYRAVIEAGANPMVTLTSDECAEIKLREGSDEQISFENPIDMATVEKVDVIISAWASGNTRSLSSVAPAKQAKASLARKPVLNRWMARMGDGTLRWVGTQFPCQSSAQDAEMSLSEYEDFVFGAGHLFADDPVAEWCKISAKQKLMADYLNTVRELKFETPAGTNLTVCVEKRPWLNCDGKENFPDGELCTSPIEDATEGVAVYSFPAIFRGTEVENIRLEFRAGKVVNASATKNEAFLHAMLDQDVGARILGEIAFGTNYGIKRFTKNTLFDEKIGGTFHAAVGNAFPECGGKNQSGLHWDMVCDLRSGGKVFADKKLISENGLFVDSSWPGPFSS